MEKTRYQTEAAQVAKMIRADLKQKFPAIKFSVRSENFAGGDAVNVSWNFGPCSHAVESALVKYRSGYFDGSIDCYEYTHSGKAIDQTGKVVDMPTVKFIGVNRHFGETHEESDTFHQKICTDYAKMFGFENDDPDYMPPGGSYSRLRQLAWRALDKADLTSGYKKLIISRGQVLAISNTDDEEALKDSYA